MQLSDVYGITDIDVLAFGKLHLGDGLFVIITISIFLSVIQVIFRKLIGEKLLEECHEVSGYIFAVVGTFYAVLIGLFVFDSQNQFEERREGLLNESVAMQELYKYAQEMPKFYSEPLKVHIRGYVERVLTYEWQAMAMGHEDEGAQSELAVINKIVRDISIENDKQNTLYDKMNDLLYDVSKERAMRIAIAEVGIPRLEWAVLLAGGISTLTFGFFFSMKNRFLQIVSDLLFAAIIGLNLFIIAQYRSPYEGEIVISKEPFERTLRYLRN